MTEHIPKEQLPPIPAKRYFTIGEVSELCGVKPHVLRYWEQEFTQLKPVKRRGNRRYYQHHEVLLIRRIRELLYEQGFTISGARHRLDAPDAKAETQATNHNGTNGVVDSQVLTPKTPDFDFAALKTELREILSLLRPALQSS
jgi:DNA-binding transcriptional MerR regulator